MTAAALAAAVLLAAGCGGGGAAPGGEPSGKEITVQLRSFEFEPSSFTLEQGQPVSLKLVSEDIEHTYTVEALGVDYRVGPGETRTVTFTPEQSGTFELICTIPGHAEAGMVGTVAVQ